VAIIAELDLDLLRTRVFHFHRESGIRGCPGEKDDAIADLNGDRTADEYV